MFERMSKYPESLKLYLNCLRNWKGVEFYLINEFLIRMSTKIEIRNGLSSGEISKLSICKYM